MGRVSCNLEVHLTYVRRPYGRQWYSRVGYTLETNLSNQSYEVRNLLTATLTTGLKYLFPILQVRVTSSLICVYAL